jgi:TPR repeat protein
MGCFAGEFVQGSTKLILCRLIWDLLERAAELGERRAQGQLALAGLHGLGPPPFRSKHLFSAGPRPTPQTEPVALTRMYFAAVGGDAFAQVVLGQRHRRGLGVPQSDASSVFFLQQPAEEAATLASLPPGLPAVRSPRSLFVCLSFFFS